MHIRWYVMILAIHGSQIQNPWNSLASTNPFSQHILKKELTVSDGCDVAMLDIHGVQTHLLHVMHTFIIFISNMDREVDSKGFASEELGRLHKRIGCWIGTLGEDSSITPIDHVRTIAMHRIDRS